MTSIATELAVVMSTAAELAAVTSTAAGSAALTFGHKTHLVRGSTCNICGDAVGSFLIQLHCYKDS